MQPNSLAIGKSKHFVDGVAEAYQAKIDAMSEDADCPDIDEGSAL
jgi:hypothetical protein